jgi:hypothetical protein
MNHANKVNIMILFFVNDAYCLLNSQSILYLFDIQNETKEKSLVYNKEKRIKLLSYIEQHNSGWSLEWHTIYLSRECGLTYSLLHFKSKVMQE